LSVQVEEVTEDTKSPFSNFAGERINKVGIFENLADIDINVRVDPMKSGVAADPR
jgi:hypothetical protein